MPTDVPQRAPLTLLALHGAPCSGKGGVARLLADRLRWPVLDKDDVLESLGSVKGLWKPLLRFVRRPLGGIAYEIIWRMASHQLGSKISVIVDTPLPGPRAYREAQEVARKNGARLLVLSTKLDHAEWVRRLVRRGVDEPDTHKLKGRRGAERWSREHLDYAIEPVHHLGCVRTDTPEATLADTEGFIQKLLESRTV